ncbi:hypothetical protein ISCGN_013079 [Ixodes scapularis]
MTLHKHVDVEAIVVERRPCYRDFLRHRNKLPESAQGCVDLAGRRGNVQEHRWTRAGSETRAGRQHLNLPCKSLQVTGPPQHFYDTSSSP